MEDNGSLSFLNINPKEASSHDHTLLRKSIKQRMFRKVAKIKHRDKQAKHHAMSAYMGWLKYCNSHRLKCKLNKRLNDEIFLEH